MKVYTGSYIGDGQTGRDIQLPFNPVVVIVKRDGASAAVWKTSAQPANQCSFFGPTTDLATGILSLGTKSFKVGTAAEVNTSGQTYHFLALAADSNDVEVGTYTGNGTDNRNITWPNSHSAAALFIVTKEQTSADPAIMRDSNESGDASTVLSTTPTLNTANLIQALTSSNFQVGTDGKVNEDTKTYYYFALFADTDAFAQGTYTGDGLSGKELKNIGIQESFLLIHNNTTALDPIFRVKTMKGDASFPLIAATAAATNQIKGLSKDDFTLGSSNSVNKSGDTFHYIAFENTSWAVSDKYHVSIDTLGYIIQSNQNGRPLYEKKPAPEFVSKFGSGDSSYRDSSFWQFWAQVNWRNGSKQLRFDDAGKFWKSENVDVSDLEKFRLSKKMTSAGQVKAGTKVYSLASFRAAQSWWDANYGYRKQLTITAPAAQSLPQGYPVVCTEDTAALVTASKLRSDRKDWRVVYWNGSSWVDLTRHYAAAALTVFPLQAALAAGGISTDYYIFYGYSAESTDKQPSTDATWNEVYQMYGTTPDANSLSVLHMKEATGTAITDTAAALDGTMNGTLAWVTAGTKFGPAVDFPGSSAAYISIAGTNLDTLSFETYIKSDNTAQSAYIFNYAIETSKMFVYHDPGGDIRVQLQGDTGSPQLTATGILNDTNWHKLRVTFDGTDKVYIYKDGSLVATLDFSGSGQANMIRSGSSTLRIGPSFDGKMSNFRLSNTQRSTGVMEFTDAVTVAQGSETSVQPPSSSFSLFAGLSDGSIHLWDGATTWTEQFDVRRLEWLDTGDDADSAVGNVAATEEKRAQSFKVDAAVNLKAISVYMRRGTAVGGFTCRIETDSASLPSGTLVNAALTAAVANGDIPTSNGWVTFTFTNAQALAGATSYWIVLQSTTFGSETGAAQVRVDGSSPSYSDGNLATKSGAGAWAADTAKDLMFRALGPTTSVNCSFVSKVGGTLKIFWGIGDITSEVNGDARIYSYDGTTWKLEKIFTTTTEAQVLSINESKIGTTTNLFVGVGPQGKIYKTSDLTTWTLSYDVEKPQNPGYPYSIYEYNRLLYAGGGSPELLDDRKYNGFFYQFNQVDWDQVFPFDHTVIKSMQFYDAFLFVGSYHGQIFVFNTVTLDPLFSFAEDYDYDVQIWTQFFFDDKLWIGLVPQDGITPGNEAIWVFNRHGMYAAQKITGVNGYYSFAQANNELFVGTGDSGYVYRLSASQYEAQGYVQSSYFDAILPSINKLYNEFVLQMNPLPANTSIKVYYKFKESDSWTQLDTTNFPSGINVAGTTAATLTFPSGTLAKKISFKVELNTSDATVTPEVTEHVLKYSVYPARKWQWSLRLLAKDFATLVDKTQDPRTGFQVLSDLEKAQTAQKLNTFVDIDGKSYSVLFHSLDQDSWVISNKSKGLEDTIAITLLEA